MRFLQQDQLPAGQALPELRLDGASLEGAFGPRQNLVLGDFRQTVLRVELEEGPFLITNLVDSDGRELTKDAPVRVVFQQAGDIFLPQFTFA
jgi:hypothetical protein